MSDNLAFIDFEACSLAKGSWPLEIGYVRADLSAAWSSVIAPAPSWSSEMWDIGAEEVHGISPYQARKYGRSAAEVVRHLNEGLSRLVLVADSPKDFQWLQILHAEAGIPPTAIVPRPEPREPAQMDAWRAETAKHDWDIQITWKQRKLGIYAELHEREWSALKQSAELIEHIALHDAMALALGWLAVDVAMAPEGNKPRLRAKIFERARDLLAATPRPFESWHPWEDGLA